MTRFVLNFYWPKVHGTICTRSHLAVYMTAQILHIYV